jgi:hypothetical protein
MSRQRAIGNSLIGGHLASQPTPRFRQDDEPAAEEEAVQGARWGVSVPWALKIDGMV